MLGPRSSRKWREGVLEKRHRPRPDPRVMTTSTASGCTSIISVRSRSTTGRVSSSVIASSSSKVPNLVLINPPPPALVGLPLVRRDTSPTPRRARNGRDAVDPKACRRLADHHRLPETGVALVKR